MTACRRALAMSENQRETRHICLYEIGNYDSSTHHHYKISCRCLVFTYHSIVFGSFSLKAMAVN